MIPAFEAANLAQQIKALSVSEFDQRPYGGVKLDRNKIVQIFSGTDAARSRRKKRPAVGLDFWRDDAPCMAGPDMRGRVEATAARGGVDIEIGWVGDFDDPDGEIQIRVRPPTAASGFA